jgi:MFS family permease
MTGVVCFALMIPVSSHYADRRSCREAMILSTILIFLFGFGFGVMMEPNHLLRLMVFYVLGFSVIGLTYGPAGTILSELFPTPIRYTGASLAFNLAGVAGASPAPYIATRLAGQYGLNAVGYYLSITAVITFLALLAVRPWDPGSEQNLGSGR